MLNAAGDLYRVAWNAPYAASAVCQYDECTFEAEGAAPETISAKAREHTRTTGHVTRVNNHRITEYRPGPELETAGG